MRDSALSLLRAAGAVSVGVCDTAPLRPSMTARGRAELAPYRSVICAAFPYFNGASPGNLALYARGPDYHGVVGGLLRRAADALMRHFPETSVLPLVDSALLPEVRAARRAGVAETGLHGLSIVEGYASFVFLGFLCVDRPLEPDRCRGYCERCGACARACPTGALEYSEKTGRVFRAERCLSHLSQKRGDFSPEEAALFSRSRTVWGCDLCQLACPHARTARVSPLSPLLTPRLDALSLRDLEGLSTRAFRKKYPRRAFTFRGVGPLLRNLRLLADAPQSDPPLKGSL